MAIRDKKLLRNIPLFALFDDEELDKLHDELDEVSYLAGQLIFSQDEEGDAMYIVQSGTIELFLYDEDDEKVPLTIIKPGEIFGEFSLLDKLPRSANARAIENSDLLLVDYDDLHALVEAHPDAALDMIAALTRRIRISNALVQARVVRNVNREVPVSNTFGERLADMLTSIASNIYFTYVSFFWFIIWIVLNLKIIPGIKAFDPFPFGLLTMVVSLEAIFLSLFVLISQNRQAAREKVRNDIEYEVNVRAETEIRDLRRKVDELQELIIQHLAAINTRLDKPNRK